MFRSGLNIRVFHNSHLIRWIWQNIIYTKLKDLTRHQTRIACLTVSHSNHYTGIFLWDCNWILFMHGWFFPQFETSAQSSFLLPNRAVHGPHYVERGTSLINYKTPVTVIRVDNLCILTELRRLVDWLRRLQLTEDGQGKWPCRGWQRRSIPVMDTGGGQGSHAPDPVKDYFFTPLALNKIIFPLLCLASLSILFLSYLVNFHSSS